MKNFWINFIVAVIFILPNVAQADTLDDFKNILASKHFFIKYTYQRDGDYKNITTGTGTLVKDKNNVQIMNAQNFSTTTSIAIEAYDGNNYYTEDEMQINSDSKKNKNNRMLDMMSKRPTMCYLKISDKLFMLHKTEKKGKILYESYTDKIATYNEVDEEFNFTKTQRIELPIGTVDSYIYNTALSPTIIALFNEIDDPYTVKYLYRRAGSGTTEDGLEYFDLKADTRTENHLNAIRYCFKDGVIKQITLVTYGKNQQTGEVTGYKTVIDVEEFNTNPDPNYFKLPENFKEVKSNEEVKKDWEKKSGYKIGIGSFRIG